jgi:replicative DNA helicase
MASTNPASSPDNRDSSRREKRKETGRGAPVVLDRVLPNSLDAEIAVLGAMLISPQDAAPLVRERLTEQHFYYGPHQVLYRELAAMQDSMQAVDMITLSQRLSDKNLLEEVGGQVYLMDLVTRVPTAAHVEHYLQIVQEKYLLRQLIAAGSDIIAQAFEQQDDVEAWVNEVEQQIFKITEERAVSGPKPIRDLIKDAFASIEKLYDQRGALSGLPTGFRDFDRLTSGLHEGEMIVIAARPSMGKTALAMNIAEHVAIDHNIPVGVFSLEMSNQELVKRMLCSRAHVNLRAVVSGFLGDRDFTPLTTAAAQLMKAPIYIDDTAGLTIHQVRARARRMKTQYDIKLIVIDYLQLMRSPSRRADQSRQVEISDISAGVKAMAKELQVPVIVLSQLNRQPDTRTDGRPKLSDLRESGAIEQDADVVGLLVRSEVYAEDKEQKAAKEGEATLIIAKQRNGPTGDVELTFRKEYTCFVDRARVDESDMPSGGGRG